MKKLIMNKQGQGMMEYIIISSLIGIVCLGAVKNIGNRIKSRAENIESNLSEKVKLIR